MRDDQEGLDPRKEGQLMESLRTKQLYYKDLKSGLQKTLSVVTMFSTLVLSMDVGVLSAQSPQVREVLGLSRWGQGLMQSCAVLGTVIGKCYETDRV